MPNGLNYLHSYLYSLTILYLITYGLTQIPEIKAQAKLMGSSFYKSMANSLIVTTFWVTAIYFTFNGLTIFGKYFGSL